MNEDTRVSVHCYEGDAYQIHMPVYLHHGCPVTIMSPEDSPVYVNQVYHGHGDHDVDAQFIGKRAYIGQDSLDRQIAQMRKLLEYPENHFLMHDADSVLLSAEIPKYLYDRDVVWSNQVWDGIPEHQGEFKEGWAHVAFQPPYFIHRKTMEAMVKVGRVEASPVMPFIDFLMVQLTMAAGLPWDRFMDCFSCPITHDPTTRRPWRDNEQVNNASHQVRQNGARFLHAIKDPATVERFMGDYGAYLAAHGIHQPTLTPAPRVGSMWPGAPMTRNVRTVPPRRRTRQYPTDSGRA